MRVSADLEIDSVALRKLFGQIRIVLQENARRIRVDSRESGVEIDVVFPEVGRSDNRELIATSRERYAAVVQ